MRADRALWPVLAALLLLAAGGVTPAHAHGPCGCLEPRLPQAGGSVRIGSPAYRVTFNPRPRDLGIAPQYLASAHRQDVAAATVMSRPRTRPVRGARFRVPSATPPGLYMVLTFDGSEGGAHNTWDYLHVIAPEGAATGATTQRSVTSHSRGVAWWLLPAAAALGACATAAGMTRRRR